MRAVEALEGIAEADARLGRRVPLPTVPLPLARWVDVIAVAPDGVEVAWNLDDSRPDTPGRLALYAGRRPPEPRMLNAATEPQPLGEGMTYREAPLAEAQPSLRPVRELCWTHGGLHLRLTGQGQWTPEQLLAIARSVT
jgi:hypothetical protein